METEINSLDEKVRQLALLCQKLRTDNSQLRQQLVSARDENQRLSEKISTATSRLESLLEKMPDDAQ
jgi:cell division protein ZapB